MDRKEKKGAAEKAAPLKQSANEKKPVLTEKQAETERMNAADSIYINRELSWMAFNERVLLEAADRKVPLLERLKFLMIYQSNLTEFYRVRIGILTHRVMLTPDKRDSLSGMLPEWTIGEVLRITREQQIVAESIWKDILKELAFNGVEVLDFKKISKVDELMSKKLFGDIKGSLSPNIIDSNHPFVIAFLGREDSDKMAVIPLHRVPAYLSFEINGCQKIVITAQLIRHFLPLLLKKENIRQSAIVEVTRNADVFLEDIAERANEDLRLKVSTMITKRKREMPVRVCIFGKLSNANRALLIKKIRVPENNVFNQSIPFDLSFRSCIGEHENFKYQECRPARNIGLKKGEYIPYIEKQ